MAARPVLAARPLTEGNLGWAECHEPAIAGAVAVAGAVSVIIGVAGGESVRPWQSYVQMGALIIWVAYGVAMRWRVDELQVVADNLMDKAEKALRMFAGMGDLDNEDSHHPE